MSFHSNFSGYFFCIGLSYKNANEDARGLYSLNKEKTTALLDSYKLEGIQSVLVISTCNRTEIYGIAKHPFQLIRQFIKHTQGSIEDFEKVAYIYKSNDAINHLFRVCAGIDSQILGDFEITYQIKKSFHLSKKLHLVNPFLERLYNSVMQAAKRIKNETLLSSGTTSVSFAAVQYILNNFKKPSEQKILLFGMGKIGANTCENLVKHIDNKHITVINRTNEKAEDTARKFHITNKPFESLKQELTKTDIIIVATSATKPTISKDLLPTDRPLLILDLSVPKNVDEDVNGLKNITTVHIDHLSKITDQTLELRKESIPDAENIISQVKTEFDSWLDVRKFAPVIKALKEKLYNMKSAEMDFQNKKNKAFEPSQVNVFADRFIQKITTHFANHLKENQDTSDESLKVIKNVFHLND